MKEELLEKYFLKQLSSDEEALFQKMLAEDVVFKETFEFETSVRKVARSNRRDTLKSKLNTFEAARNHTDDVSIISSETKSTTSFWKVFGIAASIAFMTAIAWTFLGDNTSNQELFAANYEVYPNTAYNITRSDTGDDSLEKKAFTLYERGNYTEAITAFGNIQESNLSADISFYKAQATLAAGQYERAQTLFQKMASGKYQAEALWYQSLTALKLDDKKEAIKSLKALVENGSYKKAESEQLLKSLE